MSRRAGWQSMKLLWSGKNQQTRDENSSRLLLIYDTIYSLFFTSFPPSFKYQTRLDFKSISLHSTWAKASDSHTQWWREIGIFMLPFSHILHACRATIIRSNECVCWSEARISNGNLISLSLRLQIQYIISLCIPFHSCISSLISTNRSRSSFTRNWWGLFQLARRNIKSRTHKSKAKMSESLLFHLSQFQKQYQYRWQKNEIYSSIMDWFFSSREFHIALLTTLPLMYSQFSCARVFYASIFALLLLYDNSLCRSVSTALHAVCVMCCGCLPMMELMMAENRKNVKPAAELNEYTTSEVVRRGEKQKAATKPVAWKSMSNIKTWSRYSWGGWNQTRSGRW